MLVFWLHNFPQKLTVSSAFTVHYFQINVQLLEIKGGGRIIRSDAHRESPRYYTLSEELDVNSVI